MATIRKRAKGWRAEVRRNGVYRSATFDTKGEASAWALNVEAEILSGKHQKGVNRPLRDALQRYMDEVSPTHRAYRNECVRLNYLMRDPIADVQLSRIQPKDVAEFRDRKLSEISPSTGKLLKPSTVKRDMNLLSGVFSIAVQEWGWLRSNPMQGVRRPKNSPHRDRRISDDEIEQILISLHYDDELPVVRKHQEVAVMFLLAIETAMRLGEIAALEWDRVFIEKRFVELPITKNADPRKVPLSRRAIELLGKVKGLDDNAVFTVNAEHAGALYRKYTKHSGVKDLRFHDTRHEALTRLARKLDVLDLARMVGHRDPRSLMVYYNATATEIAGRLDGP